VSFVVRADGGAADAFLFVPKAETGPARSPSAALRANEAASEAACLWLGRLLSKMLKKT